MEQTSIRFEKCGGVFAEDSEADDQEGTAGGGASGAVPPESTSFAAPARGGGAGCWRRPPEGPGRDRSGNPRWPVEPVSQPHESFGAPLWDLPIRSAPVGLAGCGGGGSQGRGYVGRPSGGRGPGRQAGAGGPGGAGHFGSVPRGLAYGPCGSASQWERSMELFQRAPQPSNV
eukprot:jgi/Botrbrau1/15178/Bobra.0149s0043.1